LEALASGVPVIAVEDDAFHNVITSGKNGFLVEEDPEIFAEKTRELLQNNTLYKQFVKNARDSVEKFSIENTAKYLEQLYIRIIEEKGEKEKKYLHVRSINNIKKFLIKTNDTLKKYYE
jgi:glycosyltransferase involved in cell wall biosynthesis